MNKVTVSAYALRRPNGNLAWLDHLYPNCPALQGVKSRHGGLIEALGSVDPLGSDLCGWCQRVYRARAHIEV